MAKTYDAAIPGARLPYTEEARRSPKREDARSEKNQEVRRSEEREEVRRSEEVALIKQLQGGLDSVDPVDGAAWSKIVVKQLC